MLDGEREQLLHALYHVQKKHATASGVLIPHHNINVLIRIGDYEQFFYFLFFTKVKEKNEKCIYLLWYWNDRLADYPAQPEAEQDGTPPHTLGFSSEAGLRRYDT